jgi:TetR/AcrR family transcriptional regulator
MVWQRARRPEQKEERRKAIMEAAADLFGDLDFDKVSLNGIARKAGLAKSNTYRYFESKEDVFLNLYLEDVTAWTSEIEDALAALPAGSDPAAVAKTIAATLAARPRLAALFTLLASVLERNVSEDMLIAFKGQLRDTLAQTVPAIRRVLPDLSEAQIGRLEVYVHALVAGLWPLATPNPIMARVLDRPEFVHMRVDFQRDLEGSVNALLVGLLNESRGDDNAL